MLRKFTQQWIIIIIIIIIIMIIMILIENLHIAQDCVHIQKRFTLH